MEYFFTYSDDIPDGCGFKLYGAVHVAYIVMIVIAAVILLTAKRYNKERFLCFLGDFLLFLIIIRIVIVTMIGKMSLYELPLHLCSIAGILCFLHARFKTKWLGQVIYTLCLPGALFALIFPNWTEYPAMNFITIQAFLFHGGIVIYALLSLKEGEIIPDFSGILYSVIFLAGITVPIYLFDRSFGVNFLFVMWPSPDSPLEWMAGYMGNPGYLAGYALLVIFVICVMNFLYYLVHGIWAGYRNNRSNRI